MTSHPHTAPTSATNEGTKVLDVTVLLPCRNEASTVAKCTTRALTWITVRGLDGEVLVVDNASTDTSAIEAQAAGARVVTENRIGYGHALRTGIAAAYGHTIIMADADNTYDLTNLDNFYDPIAKLHTHDIVIGNRFNPPPTPAAMNRTHRIGNWTLSTLTHIMTGTPITDIHCGLRAFTRTTMLSLPTWSTGMEYATHMLTHAHHQQLRITQTPITLHPPTPGRQSHLHPLRDGLRHLVAIARETGRPRDALSARPRRREA